MRGQTIGLLLLLLSGIAPLSAATITVCSSGCNFTRITDAHNAAVDDDVIDVRGNLTEKAIILTKRLTITSSLSTRPIVQAAPVPGVATDRVFYLANTAVVTIRRLIIRHGNFGSGGGVFNFGGTLTLDDVELRGNRASNGAAVQQTEGSSTTIQNSLLIDNRASDRGGGVRNIGGTLTVERSTFARNDSYEGGAIYSENGMGSGSSLVRLSTIYGNRGSNGGGGIFNLNSSVDVRASTFSDNSLRAIQSNGGNFAIRTSILGNSRTVSGAPDNDCRVFLTGFISDFGRNLVEDRGNCVFSGASFTGVDTTLLPLADYGGPTPTMALVELSAAINTGDVGSELADQRGIPRPQLGGFDIGAYELDQPAGEDLPDQLILAVTDGNRYYTAYFERYSVRGPNFLPLRQGAGGVLSTPVIEQESTYIGSIPELPDAIAAAMVERHTGKRFYRVVRGDGTEWINTGDATTISTDNNPVYNWPALVPKPGGSGAGLAATDIGVDLPFHRFQNVHGGDAREALARIEYSVLSSALAYLREAGISYRLGRVLFRGNQAADPYAPLIGMSDPGCLVDTHCLLLDELTHQWTHALPASSYDLALVIRSEDGAGLANSSAVAPGFSSNDATSDGDFSLIYRHESGHNWSLSHYDGGIPAAFQGSEGQTINSGNQLATMSGPEQALVEDFRQQRSAFLDALPPPAFLIPPQAATDTFYVPARSGSFVLDVLANDHDANGDSLALLSADGTPSAIGDATVSTAGGMSRVVYHPGTISPTSAFHRFGYRIHDASGQEGVGNVFVRLVNFGDVYEQNFSFSNGFTAFNDGSFVTQIFGDDSVRVQGGALQLTPDAFFRRGSYTLPMSELERGYTLSFRFKLSAAGDAGDGFTVNFGDPIASRIGGGYGGFAHGLAVEFRTWPDDRIVASIDDVAVAGGNLPFPNLVNNTWRNVVITWRQGQLSMSINGSPVLANLAVPGFTPDPADMLAFSGRTGGVSQQVLIDDIRVVTSRPVFTDGFE